ncbi:MAG: alpha/beta hydrolase [Spirochaetes bacterium GWB1_36_13]|nr:MAG: alpha/beta hydrolase [Spirochaetes bacterium GWB1_36_13]
MPYQKINGVNLYYEVLNKDGKETVAFFNGVMASTSSWGYQAALFEKMGYRVILHDFKGQLLSEKPEMPYLFKDHAAEAKGLFDFLGVEKLHLVGTSYGGEIAMRFAMDFPETVKTISVINSVSELDEMLRLFILGWKNLAAIGDAEAFYWGMTPTIYHPDYIQKNKHLLQERAESLKTLGKEAKEYFRGQIILYDTFLNEVTMTHELQKIKCPALVVCGMEDILKPPKFSKIIAENIKNSELAFIPDCGHVTIFEKPEVLNSLLLGFIGKNISSKKD